MAWSINLVFPGSELVSRDINEITGGVRFCSTFSEALHHADDFFDYTSVWVSGSELNGEPQCYTGINIDSFWISREKGGLGTGN